MSRSRCLSDFWREVSEDRVCELASVLQGSDSMVGVMGSGIGVWWASDGNSSTWFTRTINGQSSADKVTLNYGPLAGKKAPFDGRDVDEVIGYAAHEGGHCLWSDGGGSLVGLVRTEIETRKRPANRRGPYSATEAELSLAMRASNIIEDAYIDFHVAEKWPVLGEYIQFSRKRLWEKNPADLDKIGSFRDPPREWAMNLWIAVTLYGQDIPANMPPKLAVDIHALISNSVKAAKSEDKRVRFMLSMDSWEILMKYPDEVAPMPKQAQSGKGQGSGQSSGEKSEASGGKGKAGDKPEAEEDSGEASPGDKADDDKGQDDESDAEGGAGDKPDEEKPAEAPAKADDGGISGPEPEKPADGQGEADEAGTEGDSEQPSQSGKGGADKGQIKSLDDFDCKDVKAVPKELLKEVLDAIAHELEDLSKSVQQVLRTSNATSRSRRADYDGPVATRIRAQVEPEIASLRQTFQRQNHEASRTVSGLMAGKLDTHKLARAGIGNQNVYMRREILSKPNLAVGLLLDVSGSMASHMNTVWATAMVFGEALTSLDGCNFLALTYTGGYNDVDVTEICSRDLGKVCLGNVAQGGGTPSGAAIATMQCLMNRMPEKNKLIIHFTDGSPDDAGSVMQAVKSCRESKVTVWAIGLKGYERTLELQYGAGNYTTLDSISDLPAKVSELLRTLVK